MIQDEIAQLRASIYKVRASLRYDSTINVHRSELIVLWSMMGLLLLAAACNGCCVAIVETKEEA
jgi:phosphotransferase system HPr-like phosphotransfer protein